MPTDPLPPGAVIRLGSGRFRTATGIDKLAASPDGKYVAVSGNGGVTVFAATGRVAARLRNPPYVQALAFTRDGTLLTLGPREDGKTVAGRYDPATGGCSGQSVFAEFNGGNTVFSPDGALIATGDGGDLVVYDAHSGRRLAKIAFQKEPVNLVGFSPDNRWLGITTEMDRFILLDRVTGGEVCRTTFKRSVSHFEFTPDGAKVAIADGSQVVTVLDLPAGKVAARVKAASPTGWAVLAPGGELLTTPVGAVAVIGYVPATGKQTRMIRTGASIHKVHLSPDGATLLATTYAGAVRLWDVKTGKQRPASAAFPGDVGQLWFPEPGRLVGLADGIGWMRWDVRTGRQERFGPRDSTFTTSAIAPDQKHVVTRGRRGPRVIDAATKKLVRRFRVGDEFGLNVSWFSPNGKELLAWGDRGLRVWDLGTGKHRDVAFGGEKDATALDVSPDGTRLAVGLSVGEGDARRGVIRVFDLATTKRVYEVPASDPPEDVVFGPDGSKFATFFRPDVPGGEFPPLCVYLHDAATGRVLRRANGPYIARARHSVLPGRPGDRPGRGGQHTPAFGGRVRAGPGGGHRLPGPVAGGGRVLPGRAAAGDGRGRGAGDRVGPPRPGRAAAAGPGRGRAGETLADPGGRGCGGGVPGHARAGAAPGGGRPAVPGEGQAGRTGGPGGGGELGVEPGFVGVPGAGDGGPGAGGRGRPGRTRPAGGAGEGGVGRGAGEPGGGPGRGQPADAGGGATGPGGGGARVRRDGRGEGAVAIVGGGSGGGEADRRGRRGGEAGGVTTQRRAFLHPLPAGERVAAKPAG